MAISEDQLDTWAKQGPKQQFVDTYNSIKSVLESANTPYSSRSYEVHLQGSYGNDTNVYGDSDVDVVIWTSDTYHYDLEHLTQAEKDLYKQTHSAEVPSAGPAFKQQVVSWLQDRYGIANVEPGKKAILLKGNQNRRSADILVATASRQYYRYAYADDPSYHKGIRFFASDGTSIVNFPKLHAQACTDKHQATKSWFKPTIRIFKNMRNRLIDKSIINDGLAPSYCIEGALWNAPVEKFGYSFQSTVADCLNWLHVSKRDDLLTANQRRWLLRDGRPDSWPPGNFNLWLAETIKFWNAGG